MTTPALQRLRQQFPDAHLALLTPAKLADLWVNHPSINSVLPFAPGEGAWTVGRRLRAEAFDTALVLPNSPRSALEVWYAGIPRRVGYARSWRRRLLTEALAARAGQVKMKKRGRGEIDRLCRNHTDGSPAGVSLPPSAHQVYEYLHLAAALGAAPEPLPPLLSVSPTEIASVWTRFRLDNQPRRPVVAIAPGAEYGPAKRWPVERFVATMKAVQQTRECFWLLLGAAGDLPVVNAIQSAAAVPPECVSNLAGATSLRELMALLKRCQVLLANDSGSTHVAAALGVSVVVPFGSTAPELTAPGLPGDPRHHLLRGSAPCAPCFRRECPIDFRCMTSIPVDRVVTAMMEVIH